LRQLAGEWVVASGTELTEMVKRAILGSLVIVRTRWRFKQRRIEVNASC
jgi:hypothetical protein